MGIKGILFGGATTMLQQALWPHDPWYGTMRFTKYVSRTTISFSAT